jgi:HK97 family phage major capsid protein
LADWRKLKTADDSNESLVGAGVTDAIPLLLGLPVLVNREMPSYSGVMLDRSAVVSAVGEVYVSVSEHRYFKFDSQLLRITWRIGQSVVRPDRCGIFTVAAPGS